MDKIILTTVLFVFNIYSAKSQNRDFEFRIYELTQFSKEKNVDFYKLNKVDGSCVVIYKNGIVLNLTLDKKENEGIANHEMHFSFYIPEYLVKVKNESDFIPVFNLVENQIKNKSFALKDYLMESIINAKETKKENIEIQDSFMKIYSNIKNQDSEVIFTINNLTNGTNFQIDFYINL